MAKVKSITELKKDQKTLADLIRKKEKEMETTALEKVAHDFINKLSRMDDEKRSEHINSIGLNKDELTFIVASIDRLKSQRDKTKTSFPAAQ